VQGKRAGEVVVVGSVDRVGNLEELSRLSIDQESAYFEAGVSKPTVGDGGKPKHLNCQARRSAADVNLQTGQDDPL
jgi:hypothetical protein